MTEEKEKSEPGSSPPEKEPNESSTKKRSAGATESVAGSASKSFAISTAIGGTKAASPGWCRGMWASFRIFLYLTGVVAVWSGVNYFELLDKDILVNVNLVLSVLLFLLAFPCSAFFRLDNALVNWSDEDRPEIAFAVALVYVLMNFLFFGAYIGWRRGSNPSKPKKVRSKEQAQG